MDIRDKIKERLSGKIIAWEEKSTRRIYFAVHKQDIVDTARVLFKELGLRFSTATAVDTPHGFEMLYHFSFDPAGEFYTVRVLLDDKRNPEIDAITPVFAGAEWVEREIWELMGINFVGHPNLKRLLLDDDWPHDDHPLRKEKS
jgi:NADH:ubiquinone oxidoreductase subunit C